MRPVEGGRVKQWFAENPRDYAKYGYPGHNGLDYSVIVGSPVIAAHDGAIELREFDAEGFGLHVLVRANGYYTLYAHLSSLERWSTPGAIVTAGERIGYSGNTGNSTGPHLHFGLRLVRPSWQSQPYRGWVDPWAFRD
jgi:murein DD-endopeptidase MepM/ murein hydrolase activator NlpD